MILAFVIIGIFGLAFVGTACSEVFYPTPWCEKEQGQFRCHLPKGHLGDHRCDDPSGEFSWASDE